jgi:hypothetical protein
LQRFTGFYPPLAERMGEFAGLFPIHPAFIDTSSGSPSPRNARCSRPSAWPSAACYTRRCRPTSRG